MSDGKDMIDRAVMSNCEAVKQSVCEICESARRTIDEEKRKKS